MNRWAENSVGAGTARNDIYGRTCFYMLQCMDEKNFEFLLNIQLFLNYNNIFQKK